MHDEGVVGPELDKDSGDLLPEGEGRHTQQEPPDAGGIGERPKHVEHGTYPDLPTHGSRMPHRRVVTRREHEADPGLLDAARHALASEVDTDGRCYTRRRVGRQ